MEKIKFGLFDLFRYTIPGLFILFSLVIFFVQELRTISSVFALIKENLNFSIGLGLVIGGYIIGIANDPIGNYMNKKIGRKIWKLPPRKNHLNEDEKHSLARGYSPENFKYIEIWNVMKGTTANLASATLIFSIVCLTRTINNVTNISSWVLIAILSLVVVFIFLKKANEFDLWARNEIDNTVNLFVFEKRPDLKERIDKEKNGSQQNKNEKT